MCEKERERENRTVDRIIWTGSYTHFLFLSWNNITNINKRYIINGGGFVIIGTNVQFWYDAISCWLK